MNLFEDGRWANINTRNRTDRLNMQLQIGVCMSGTRTKHRWNIKRNLEIFELFNHIKMWLWLLNKWWWNKRDVVKFLRLQRIRHNLGLADICYVRIEAATWCKRKAGCIHVIKVKWWKLKEGDLYCSFTGRNTTVISSKICCLKTLVAKGNRSLCFIYFYLQ